MVLSRIKLANMTLQERELLRDFYRAVGAYGLFSKEANNLRQKLGHLVDSRETWRKEPTK